MPTGPQPTKESAEVTPSQQLESADAEEHHDRWAWQRRMRQDPKKHALYRMLVAVIGLVVIIAGLVSGPVPGPGGIPLVLLGLAIWSSEFTWAKRLMRWFKQQLRRFRDLSQPQQVVITVLVVAAVLAAGYGYLALLGPPGWFPTSIDNLFHRLPGV